MNHSLNEQLMARKAAATPRGVGVMGTFHSRASWSCVVSLPAKSSTGWLLRMST